MAVKTEAELESELTTNFTDGGANTAAEFRAFLQNIIDTLFDSSTSMDITGLTAETTLDEDNDYLAVYDNSAGLNRKVLWGTFKNLFGLKDPVRAATTTSGTLSTDFENGDSLDGITLATGDRVLIKNQVTESENGIYTVNASGAPTRATDFDSGTETPLGTLIYIQEGTVNNGKYYSLTSPTGTITIGSSNLVFSEFRTFDISQLSSGSIDDSEDYFPFYDVSDGSNKYASTSKIVQQTGLSDAGAYDGVYVKCVESGDWNMDSTAAITVAHSLSNYNRIRSVSCSIRDDADANGYNLEQDGYISWDDTNINLTRNTSVAFDSTDFDSTSYNRAVITIVYEL